MKNLLFKEFKLILHPICICFVTLFPLMALIPSYPKFISFIYIFTCYPIIFIGAEKGSNNNDVFYSLTLPVRRKDIVLARMLLLTVLQVVCAIVTMIFVYISTFIPEEANVDIGFTFESMLTMVGFCFIALSFLDLIYLPIFYKTARNITAATLISGLVYITIIMALNLGIPYLPGIGEFFLDGNILKQIITFVICILIYVGIRYLSFIISSKRFEKVDF